MQLRLIVSLGSGHPENVIKLVKKDMPLCTSPSPWRVVKKHAIASMHHTPRQWEQKNAVLLAM